MVEIGPNLMWTLIAITAATVVCVFVWLTIRW